MSPILPERPFLWFSNSCNFCFFFNSLSKQSYLSFSEFTDFAIFLSSSFSLIYSSLIASYSYRISFSRAYIAICEVEATSFSRETSFWLALSSWIRYHLESCSSMASYFRLASKRGSILTCKSFYLHFSLKKLMSWIHSSLFSDILWEGLIDNGKEHRDTFFLGSLLSLISKQATGSCSSNLTFN